MRMLFIVWMLLAMPAAAQETTADTPLMNAAQETQARELFRELRCEVCEGQTIADSNAALASDMRALVRHRIAAGDTPDDIKHWLAERYGESILMRPPLAAHTLPLWLAPAAMLLLGGVFFVRYFRREREVKE